jgi:conjugal transfer pilus assembly protein TraD
MSEAYRYRNPWRPLYETYGVVLWSGTAMVAWVSAPWWDLYTAAFHWVGVGATVMAATWMPAWIQGINRREWLAGRPIQFIPPETVVGRLAADPTYLWVGWAFEWLPRHAQEAIDLLRAGPDRYAPRHPERIGATWIHGIGGNEEEARVPLGHVEGHTLVVGTTGSGKTRLFDLLVTQAVLRGEAVIIIDPKGDQGLRTSAERACLLDGRPERYQYFHPAFAEHSIRLNPMANFQRASELASRIAALIPSETGNDPFKAFGQMALSHIVTGMLSVGEQPTILTLRGWLEGGLDALVQRVLTQYLEQHVPYWRDHAETYLARARDSKQRTKQLLAYYKERVRPHHPSAIVDGLASQYAHEAVHFSKMIASLMPILTMLTSASLETLLSPDTAAADDPRPITSLSEVLARRQVLYVGLDSLSDSIVGGAIGSLLTADLAATAGAIYNQEPEPVPVNIFIDEAAEVVSDPMVQVLNKGRGAGLSLTIATQSFADFAARTGSQDKARQVLANVNNLVALRVLDGETQEYVAEALPEIRLRKLVQQQGAHTDAERPLLFTGNVAERLDEEPAPLFPAPLLGQLPNLEYVAKWAGGHVTKGRLPILGTPHTTRAERIEQALGVHEQTAPA